MWFYVSGGQQVGPVDDRALDDLVRQGVVRDDTLVWKEGMPSWQPHAAVRGPRTAPAPSPVAPPPAYAPPPAAQPYAPQPYAPQPAPQPYVQPTPGGLVFDYALWPTRVMGALIDYLFVGVVMAILYFLGFVVFGSMVGLGSGLGNAGPNAISDFGSLACCCMLMLLPVSTLLVGVYNKVHLVSSRGFSIGQGIMKLKVLDGSGNKLSFGTAFVRLLAQAGLSLIWIGSLVDHLWPLWDERRQTLHDKAVNCYVINNPSGM